MIRDVAPMMPLTRRATGAVRRRVSRWRRLAAMLALLTPLMQQRPALLDAVPMAHAGGSPAGHSAAAIPDASHAHEGHAPAAPRALWCCELAAIPVVAMPWLASALVTAPLVAVAVAPIARRHPPAARVSQIRLPFATAPPTLPA